MADKAIPDISLGGAEQNMSREDLAAVAKAVAALSLEAVLSQLEAVPSVELVLPAPEGAPYHLRCSPLEGMPGVLLVTCRRLPAGTPSPAP